ncbi:MAG: hypothetical protein HYV35_07380 [Lentisphaerae bacterium]|nr:hypothetical protein [Lentisphaerota bacterium]
MINSFVVLLAVFLIGHLADVMAAPISGISSTSTTNTASNARVTASPTPRPGISLKQLDNMEYWTDRGKCRLTYGEYISWTNYKDDPSIRIYREVMRGTYISGVHEVDHADYAFGDLNNDGLEDAVVILRENTGGTGVFLSLAIVMNEKGKIRNTATVPMGDRQEITSLTIGAGMIRVAGFTHRPTEGYMQPTLPAVWLYIPNGRTVELISGPKGRDKDEYGKRFEQLMNEK